MAIGLLDHADRAALGAQQLDDIRSGDSPYAPGSQRCDFERRRQVYSGGVVGRGEGGSGVSESSSAPAAESILPRTA